MMKISGAVFATVKTMTVVGVLCLQAEIARAALAPALVYNFDNSYSGGTPAGPAPWLVATFQNDGSSGVLLTINGADLAGREKLDSIYFNLDPSLNVSKLKFSLQSSSAGLIAPTVSTGENEFKAGGSGDYDLKLDFSTRASGAFYNGDSITYLISGIRGLTAGDFASRSGSDDDARGFYAAAHVLGIGPCDTSAWIEPDDGPMSFVPEPAAFGFAAAGVAGVLALFRKKSA